MKVVTMGEAIVEIMRDRTDSPLSEPGYFRGPFPSGAPAIFIDAVARLGIPAAMISGVGDDDFGEVLRKRLAEDGVDTDKILVDKNISTGCAFVSYDSSGDRKFIFHIGNTPAVKAPVPEEEFLEDTGYFHIMGCSVMADRDFGERIIKTMELASQKGARISFDSNIRPELMKDPDVYSRIEKITEHTDLFMPGKSELLQFSGKETVAEAVSYYFDRYEKMDMIVVKDGSNGATCYTRDNSWSHGIYRVDAVDPTGAGDTFDGAFISCLLLGKGIEEALETASAAAAINTANFGPMEGRITWEKIRKMTGR